MKVKLTKSNNWLNKNDYDISEEEEIYDFCLAHVLENTRWYLDNLENLKEFRVSWKNYSNNKPVVPFKYVKKQEGL